MLPSKTPWDTVASPQEGNLEDRLRGLILNHNPGPGVPMQPSAKPAVPPHLMMATQEDQHAYFMRGHAVHDLEPRGSIHGQQAQSFQPHTGRKRPNQAQRRQLSSQLSIPIDTRPQQSVQFVRGHGNAQQSQPNRYIGNAQRQYGQSFPKQSSQTQQPLSPYSSHSIYWQDSQPVSRAQAQLGNQQVYNQQGPKYPPKHNRPGNLNAPGEFHRPQPRNQQIHEHDFPIGQGHGRPPVRHDPDDVAAEINHLERLCLNSVGAAAIESEEETKNESFRLLVEQACRKAITDYEHQELENATFDPISVELKCFGSMSSGFATKASDMDLALLSPHSKPPPDSSESCIPRILEKKLLDAGYGARLLTKTRVPIIKLCEKPTEKLKMDLMVERMKWETGFTEDEKARTETHDADVPTQTNQIDASKKPTNLVSSPIEPIHDKQAGFEGHDYLVHLKQEENQTLVDYYRNAKQVLRKMQVADLSASAPQNDIYKAEILNNVCKAFISGLSSEPLSIRLRGYKSISPLFDESPALVQRSLSGIWTQVGGERLAMAYDSRSLTEADEKRETQCLAFVEAWRRLQDEVSTLDDPLLYDRQLYMAFERLKSMSSLALVILEQIDHELPDYYAARARRLMDDLRSRNQMDVDTVNPIVIAHYASGINNPQIREDMRHLSSCQQSFQDVVLQHKALQLAADFEHALKRDLYVATDEPYVEQYIKFLRSRSISSQSQKDDANLLAVIRQLPDPTKISLSKPRDRFKDQLEFPKSDVGIQCDINFSATLALHNTLLLRCYSHSDPRVRILILFVKHWAKVRAINTPYRGTLSSYGFVLMVLHYLVNIAFPFVCPNLQEIRKDPPTYLPYAEIEARTICKGRDVRFWRNEAEIKNLANRGLLNQNRDSVGFLLRGFFEYFAQNAQMSLVPCRGFDWGREVLSLRTRGGLLTKQEKGWTSAKTEFKTTTPTMPPTSSTPSISFDRPKDPVVGLEGLVDGDMEGKSPKLLPKTIEETKEIRHRYLFAIEDPFELDHNVARTVSQVLHLARSYIKDVLVGYSQRHCIN